MVATPPPVSTSIDCALQTALTDLLSPVYGPTADLQLPRYVEALENFQRRFGPGPVSLFRAPGRINLIGGHTDYNHGYVMPVALDRDLLLLARRRQDRRIFLANIEAEFAEDLFTVSDNVPNSPSFAWTNYVRGAAQMIAMQSPDTYSGMDCLAVGAAPFGIPRGSGLSSSSALTVAATLTLAHFAGLNLSREVLVQLCSDAEWYAGTRGGIMDQYISLFAERNHALFLDCRPNADGGYSTRLVPLPEDYELIVAESGVRHNNVRGEYNKRVASCRAGLAYLRGTYPHSTHLRDLENVDWTDLEQLLPEEVTVEDAMSLVGSDIQGIPGLDPTNVLYPRACCRHVWQENRRVVEAYSALLHGDVPAAGKLISLAHASARDNYRISFPEMETLVDAASRVPGVVGGRITGAGWGGCAVFLVERKAVPKLIAEVEQDFQSRHDYKPSIFPCRSGTAAGYLGTVPV